MDFWYWFCLGITFFVASVYLCLLFTLPYRKDNILPKESITSNLGSGVAGTGLACIAQDITAAIRPSIPFTNSLRIAIFVLGMYGALNLYVYNAGLTSHLTVSESQAVNSLEDFLRRPELDLIMIHGGSSMILLKGAKDSVMKAVWRKISVTGM